jgi:ketopantoate hydroxymethyltransferase
MLGLSGFYPKFVKKYANLNRIIEKAVKKYTREVKLKKFPSTNNFLNGTKLDNKTEFKDKLIIFL